MDFADNSQSSFAAAVRPEVTTITSMPAIPMIIGRPAAHGKLAS